MLFNSLDFVVFLPIVFILYWFVINKSLSLQNLFLVITSYVFYAWWDYRFLALIALSTIIDYYVAKQLKKTEKEKQRKGLLILSLVFNLGMLAFFKYCNFFIDSWIDAWSMFGVDMQVSSLQIILPVGISFYTFQTLSYTIDVYRKKIEPTTNFIQFAAFVSFFPQLVAGPIERASHLLPQFNKKRIFNTENAISGIYLIVWGLFKKVVIADNCAQFANDIFSNYNDYSSFTLLLGVFYFAFQIYGDFSGYSDMAIGISRLFGFDLKQNFALPYFSRDIAEFWRRWHISLSTWFRDYLYIPLGGSRGSVWNKIRNVFLIFIVSGFWHGANWTFVFWGALNALYFLPLLLLKRNRKYTESIAENRILPSFRETYKMATTFALTLFAWIFFRSETIEKAIYYIEGLADFTFNLDKLQIKRFPYEILPLILILVLIEWFSRFKENPIKNSKYPIIGTVLIILMIFVFGSFSSAKEFIYFQF